jgi:hypothetical protein
MNYIWHPLIDAMQSGVDTARIRYRVKDDRRAYEPGDARNDYYADARRISPFLEYMPHILYDPEERVRKEDKYSRVDINPFHRFENIFGRFLSPDSDDPNDMILCDILTHMLAHIDRICGMSKRDFRIMIIINELFGGGDGGGGGGGGTEGSAALFGEREKRAVAEALIMLYETLNPLRALDSLFRTIMGDFTIQIRDNEEIVFYNRYGYDAKEDEKLRFIIKLFLPIDMPYAVHFRHTYGTVGLDESMAIEGFVI